MKKIKGLFTKADDTKEELPDPLKVNDLKNLIEEENLNEKETRKFIEYSFREGQVKTNGTDLEKILPPMRRFGGGNRAERKETIIQKVKKFFEKYLGLNTDEDNNFDKNNRM